VNNHQFTKQQTKTLNIKKSAINKTGMTIRIFASFVFLCGIIATSVSIFMLFAEPKLIDISFIISGGWLTHLSGTVSMSGYPPRYLYWASTEKKNNNE